MAQLRSLVTFIRICGPVLRWEYEYQHNPQYLPRKGERIEVPDIAGSYEVQDVLYRYYDSACHITIYTRDV